jgi:hypothetical protein
MSNARTVGSGPIDGMVFSQGPNHDLLLSAEQSNDGPRADLVEYTLTSIRTIALDFCTID